MYDLNVLGEKYLGNWLNNMKNGNGLMVTQEGIYYEGVFVQDVLTVRVELPITLQFPEELSVK